ncbi:hypothetical protein KR084_010789, partial [Drosophila pseudotakahashii]
RTSGISQQTTPGWPGQWEKSQQAANELHNCSRKFCFRISNLPTSGKHNNGFDLTILPP